MAWLKKGKITAEVVVASRWRVSFGTLGRGKRMNVFIETQLAGLAANVCLPFSHRDELDTLVAQLAEARDKVWPEN